MDRAKNALSGKKVAYMYPLRAAGNAALVYVGDVIAWAACDVAFVDATSAPVHHS